MSDKAELLVRAKELGKTLQEEEGFMAFRKAFADRQLNHEFRAGVMAAGLLSAVEAGNLVAVRTFAGWLSPDRNIDASVKLSIFDDALQAAREKNASREILDLLESGGRPTRSTRRNTAPAPAQAVA